MATGRRKAAKKRVSLALQGGGAHGAFTWGALDRLLEDGRLEIEGISGTSAGAMNAAVLADGYCRGGPEAARAALDRFWQRIGEIGRLSPLRGGPLDWWARACGFEPSPSFLAFDAATHLLSPYQFNPLNWHPLRDLLDESIDFALLARESPIRLFISATNARSGKNRVFEQDELSLDVVLASACLPFLFQAVEIGDEAYWDGGYMGNPAIYPLIYGCASPDVVIVQVNPIVREELPTTAPAILDRVNEISFNSTLMREMRAIAFVTRLIDQGHLRHEGYKRMNIHMIEEEEVMRSLGIESKFNPDPRFLETLKDTGRRAAGLWLEAHYEDIGERSSLDIAERFL
jgi:NTE family protein